MSTKLTLTLEQHIIEKAKKYAKNKGRVQKVKSIDNRFYGFCYMDDHSPGTEAEPNPDIC